MDHSNTIPSNYAEALLATLAVLLQTTHAS
ncbi:hypothetical protein SAMN06265337_1222 [Hymenobacter gelipurpurascens]|uniref:Uncharacterized protein n=1 Tax=Hymenobacter gelipurpurascens TaxID=89968 RepID=A0A212TH14_9BACT|nr:hypothetical protein SAMN06265337_1222 [Hymenobacter gelipurpurascens]